MTSSIATPSQSGILGEGGRKVLKTRVQILGRHLMEPGETLSADLAARLADQARASRAHLRTKLTLFSTGLRLGERGVFTSMPVEFVKYHRLSDMVSPASHPSVLLVCVKDYDQRCVTIVQFKDDVCLRVVVDVINRHRRAMDEDVARMSDLHSVNSTMRKKDKNDARVGQGGSANGGNWRLIKEEATSTASHSMLDDDYAIIRRSRMAASETDEAESPEDEKPPTPASVQQQWHQSWKQNQQQRRQSQTEQLYEHRYQKKSEQQSQKQQLLQQHYLVAAANADLEEVETAAIFETIGGPPTLLNELVLRGGVGGGVGGEGFDRHGSRERDSRESARISQLPPEFVARARVEHNTEQTVAPANGGYEDNQTAEAQQQPPVAQWAPLEDLLDD